MVNIGIDFGSTYTTVSVYDNENRIVKSLRLGHSKGCIPSVVTLYKGNYEWGQAAKSMSVKKDVKAFRAFKMLLAHQDELALFQRGYDAECTPVKAASAFLKSVLTQALSELHEDKIGCLVIGVPEIWNEKITTLEGRANLRNICKSLNFVDHVKVVSEPVASAAFLSHRFYEKTGRNFEGHMLLVDYGGGTLDITLTQVLAGAEASKNVEIKILERAGAGENEEGQSGMAGIAYMEKVMSEAILRSEKFPKDILSGYDAEFYRAVDMLERALWKKEHLLAHIFEEYGVYDIEGLNREVFVKVPFYGVQVEITCGLLADIYNQLIRGVLDEKLDTMIDYMKEQCIGYMDRDSETFKIALVGGFGSFCLVKKQIAQKFKLSAYDRRCADIISDRSDCKMAGSLGAALIASDVVGIRNVAPYAIGVWAYDIDRKVCLNYAIKYRQEIKADKIYYARGALDHEIFVVQAVSGSVDRFLVNFGADDRTACFAYAKDALAKRLENVIKNKYRTAVIGFSVDCCGVVSIHIRDYDVFEGIISDEDHVIELTRFNELFEMTGTSQYLFGGQ